MHLAGLDFAPFQPHLRGIGWWKSAVPKLEPHVPDDVMHTGRGIDIPGFVFSQRSLREAAQRPDPRRSVPDNVLLVRDGEDDRIGGVIDFYFAGVPSGCSTSQSRSTIGVSSKPAANSNRRGHTQCSMLTTRYVRSLRMSRNAGARRCEPLHFDSGFLVYTTTICRDPLTCLRRTTPHFERILKCRTAAASLPWVTH